MSNFLRITEVMKITGLAKSTVWLWVKEGNLPQPIKLSPRVTVWEEEKISNLMKKNILRDGSMPLIKNQSHLIPIVNLN